MDVFFLTPEGSDSKWPANGTGEGEREGPEGLPDTSSSRFSDYDGRSPRASVIDKQKQEPSSPQKKRHPCSLSIRFFIPEKDTHAPFRNLTQILRS
jgi:hypothetical protein